MLVQLTEQTMEFLAPSALPYLKDFLPQGMHRFMLGQQGLYPGQFRRMGVQPGGDRTGSQIRMLVTP